MKKLAILFCALLALALPTAAAASKPAAPTVICGGDCGGGTCLRDPFSGIWYCN